MIFSQSHKLILNKSWSDVADSGSGVSLRHSFRYRNSPLTHICEENQPNKTHARFNITICLETGTETK